jgi:hypothetical protein
MILSAKVVPRGSRFRAVPSHRGTTVVSTPAVQSSVTREVFAEPASASAADGGATIVEAKHDSKATAGSSTPAPRTTWSKRTMGDRLDTFVSRLSTRSNFWHRVCSLIWLPYAFKSGIRMKRVDGNTFSAILPFRRFNRNWYNAMAGAALLANSEVAGGMYVFAVCGGEYTVVCKNLEYKFLRPCYGPALYRVTPREDLTALARAKQEFNVTLELDIVQLIGKKSDKERRVGKCIATFHATPKQHQKSKGRTIR